MRSTGDFGKWALLLSGLVLIWCCRSQGWQLVSSDPDTEAGIREFRELVFDDAAHGWSVTLSHLLETSDGGRTWSKRADAGLNGFLSSLVFINRQAGWVVGETQGETVSSIGLLLKTTDAGKTWRRRLITEVPGLDNVSFCTSSEGWASSSGLIIRTLDGGETWEKKGQLTEDDNPVDIECTAPDAVWVVGRAGLIAHTKDSGNTWVRETAITTEHLTRVRFFGQNGWILGAHGLVLRTRDDGRNWVKLTIPTRELLTDVTVLDQIGWLVGTQGTILTSKDGGDTWEPFSSPTNQDLSVLFFLDSSSGWAGGDRLTLLRYGR